MTEEDKKRYIEMLEMNANIGLLLNANTKPTRQHSSTKEYDPMDFGRSSSGP